MGIFQQFPYTNFHDMNLDEIIKIVKQLQDEWAATSAEWASYKDFIDNYFENLDVSDEVLEAIRVLASTGELNTIIDPTIITEVTAWLADHITQPTTPAIDTSLTIAGAAADAKATGDTIKATNDYVDYLTNIAWPLINQTNIFTRTGWYVNNSGWEQSNANFVTTKKIFVRSGTPIKYNQLWGNSGVVATLAFYDTSNVYVLASSLIGTGVYQSGIWTAPSDGYVQFSLPVSYLSGVSIYIGTSRPLIGYFNNSIYTQAPVLKSRNETFETFGDSLIAQSYLSSTQRTQAWLQTLLETGTVYNHGVDQSTVTDQPGRNGMCTDARINALTAGVHAVIVMGGTNDWASSVPIGEESLDNTNTLTFFGACNVMFQKLITKYAAARIVALGAPFGFNANYMYFTDPTGFKNNLGLRTCDYAAAMMKSAELNGIEHYNIGAEWGVGYNNRSSYLLSENSGDTYIHPNAAGAYRFAQYIAKNLGE